MVQKVGVECVRVESRRLNVYIYKKYISYPVSKTQNLEGAALDSVVECREEEGMVGSERKRQHIIQILSQR